LQLLRVNLLWWHNLRRLARCLGMLKLRWLLGQCASGLVLWGALVRLGLRLGWKRVRVLLLLILDVLGKTVLR